MSVKGALFDLAKPRVKRQTEGRRVIPAGWTQLGPGIYVDAEQDLHLSIPELLLAHGYADTPANRDCLTRQAVEIAHQMLPEATVVVEVPDAKRPHGES